MANTNPTCCYRRNGDVTLPACGAPATFGIDSRALSLCGRHAAARVRFMGAASNVQRAEVA